MNEMAKLAELSAAPPAAVRQAIREERWLGPTAGMARGYAQANVVILPESCADDFARFCALNPRPCPLITRTSPGDPVPREVAPDADMRTDVPRYRVFRHGLLEAEVTNIRELWRADLVVFLLGCSFTFESALLAAQLPVRHIAQGKNVPMYRTNLDCLPAATFRGPLVVSMRPYEAEQIEEVTRITAEFPRMHGAPLFFGDPAAIGIKDLAHPDFGDPVTIEPDEIPVFWACGVTPQLALAEARPEICITHSPGCMFVMDRTDESFREKGDHR